MTYYLISKVVEVPTALLELCVSRVLMQSYKAKDLDTVANVLDFENFTGTVHLGCFPERSRGTKQENLVVKAGVQTSLTD
jgi:hypothetical protein